MSSYFSQNALLLFFVLWPVFALAQDSFAVNVAKRCSAIEAVAGTEETGNAGCFIEMRDKVVTIRRDQKYTLPGGEAKPLSDKSSKLEPVWVTACRETLQEVFGMKDQNAVSLKVGIVLKSFPAKYRNQKPYTVFYCTLDENGVDKVVKNVPYSVVDGDLATDDIISVDLLDPRMTGDFQWSYAGQRQAVLSIYKKLIDARRETH